MSQIDNLFARDGFYWWVGVVEDRKDPLKLGRCRVRVLGYHIENKRELPTQDLPWAMPMQPITSAANSGKGQTPLGPLEGTWVVGFFADGADCQQPIMMGTMGGIPETSVACASQNSNETNSANSQKDGAGNIIYDENGNAAPVTPSNTSPSSTASNSITKTLPPLSQDEIQSLMNTIALRESSSVAGGVQNYSTINTSGYVGKYQFGAAALITNGYLKPPLDPKAKITNSMLNDSRNWTGKGDVNSLDDFINNKNNVQETAMFENINFNYGQLQAKGAIDAAGSSKEQVAGYLAAAHIAGAGGANQLRLGKDYADNLGTRTSEYYALGSQSQGGTGTVPVAASNRSTQVASLNSGLNLIRTAFGALNNPKLGQPDGYADPNGVYPTCPYTDRQDTNKLATNNDDLKTTPKPAKDNARIDNVETANNASGSWAEPPSAYAAKYPYNHVKETESGHVVEFDDTPNAERIHVYHKSGTYVEIDREGTVSYKVLGENYNIYGRNNRVYTQGNMDVTVDGAKTLLVKNTLDVEVVGKTTINLKDDADINVSKDLRIKAQNIYMEAQQDINITAGNYENHKVGGDLNYRVTGDEQHRVTGDLDMDAQDINLNSGTANPYTAITTELDDGVQSNLTAQGFEATGLNPLPTDIANVENSYGKGLSGFLGGFSGGGLGLLGNALGNTAIANAVSGFSLAGNVLGSGALQSTLGGLGGGGIGSLLKIGGVDGLNSVLSTAGLSQSFTDIIGNAAANPAINNAITGFSTPLDAIGGLGNLNSYIDTNGLGGLNSVLTQYGLPSAERLVADAGIDLNSLIYRAISPGQLGILNSIKSSDLIDQNALAAGDALIADFYKNGVANIDTTLSAEINGAAVDATEFIGWTDFPAGTQLSKYYTLGDLSSRVADTNAQFDIQDQGDLTRYDIISNMKALAANTLDPITERYPNVIISDGFKPANQYLLTLDENNAYKDLIDTIKANATTADAVIVQTQLDTLTPYQKGQAVNLQFKGVSASEYYTIAQWIKNNVAYDQLRLEYTTLGSKEPWIGISYNSVGNRLIDNFDKIVTTMNGQVVANYLADLTS